MPGRPRHEPVGDPRLDDATGGRGPSRPSGAAARCCWSRSPRRDLPAQAHRAGRLAERRLPARGAARSRPTGGSARPATSLAQRGRVQLLPPAAGRPVHDRRQPQLGGAGGVRRSSRSSAAPGRARPRRAQRGRAPARAKPTSRPSWRASCSAARRPDALAAAARRRRARRSGSASAAIELGAVAGDQRRRGVPAARADGAQMARCWCRAACRPTPSSGCDAQVVPALERARRVALAATRSQARRSRPRRCAAATRSRPRCCARSPTTCARR